MIKCTVFLNVLLFTLISEASLDCSLKLNDLSEAKKYNYLLVPGIFNEVLSFYMTEHRSYLMSLGVPRSQIFRLNNSSYIKPENNAVKVKEALSKIKADKKIVIIAHSKGALEVLYHFFEAPDLSRVERVFLLQGALDGSSSYNMVMGKAPLKGFLSYVRSLYRFKFVKNFSESFNFLDVREKLKGISKRKDFISKITFIESEKKLKDLPAKFSLIGGLYQENFKSAGDGILLKKDHVPYELQEQKGVCRKVYEAHHAELVKAYPWNRPHVRMIQSFIRELLLGFKGDQ